MTVATDPVLSHALSVVRQALIDRLTPAIPYGRVFWGMGGTTKELPRLLLQPSDAGKAVRYIGQPAGWEGLIAVRVYAPTLDEAEALLLFVGPALPATQTITAPDDSSWVLGIRSIRPIPGLPGPSIAVAGIVYRVRIEAV